MAQAEKTKTTQTKTTSNVIDVTAQFKNQPPASNTDKPPETPPADMSNKSDTSDGNKDDGTIYQNE